MGKRMFNTDITDADRFLDLPPTTQNLYFHLGMHGDDDGFVSAPKRTMRSIGSSESDMENLISAGFVYKFESGVVVIIDWHINNNLRNDRYKPTIHTAEKSSVYLDDSKRYTIGIPSDNQTVPVGMRNITEHSIAEHSKAKQNQANEAKANDKGIREIMRNNGCSPSENTSPPIINRYAEMLIKKGILPQGGEFDNDV